MPVNDSILRGRALAAEYLAAGHDPHSHDERMDFFEHHAPSHECDQVMVAFVVELLMTVVDDRPEPVSGVIES